MPSLSPAKALVLAVSAVALIGGLLYWPTVRQALASRSNLAQLRADLDATPYMDAVQVRQRTAALTDELQHHPHRLGHGPEPHQVLAQLADAAVRAGLEDYDITLRDAQHFDQFSRLPAQINFTGQFDHAFAILRAIDLSPRLLRADVVRLERNLDPQGRVNVTTTVDLSALFLDPDHTADHALTPANDNPDQGGDR